MSNASDPFFRTFHALRIKGFAKAETIAEVADLPLELVEEHLQGLVAREWAQFREARELWQLTAVGREEHHIALAEDVGGAHMSEQLHGPYQDFLALNESFKVLCGDLGERHLLPPVSLVAARTRCAAVRADRGPCRRRGEGGDYRRTGARTVGVLVSTQVRRQGLCERPAGPG